jgi:N-acetyl-anhydromuramyl-L-alanine amidase AmpD
VKGFAYAKFIVVALSLWLGATTAFASLKISNEYFSPRNRERSERKSTQLIILHTTESSSSALRKLRDMGECHYCIDEAGRVYRIVDVRRVAFHSGRSMWNGKQDVDNFSIGIEVCGYHNKPLNAAQMHSLKELIGMLQRTYKIPDYHVLAHSHVAYGVPNKWQKQNHRGRKRCGMVFAMPSVRAQLGLKSRPQRDPDVAARRLVNGDPELSQVLYGTASAFQLGGATASIQARTPPPPPPPPKPKGAIQTIGVDGNAQDIVTTAIWSSSVFYIYPDGKYRSGNQLTAEEILKLPYGTKVLQDYAVGGPVLASSPPSVICGNRWRDPTTFYLISGALVPGDKVDDRRIPSGTMLFFKK